MAPALLSGSDVLQIQKALNRQGKSALPKLAEDGVFGPKTRARVIEFQRSRGLVADGVVGPKTRAALGLPASGGAPGAGIPGGAPGLGDISRDFGKGIAGAVANAVQYALQMWKLQASFRGIVINGATAFGGPGCLTGPNLGSLISFAPSSTSARGDDEKAIVSAAAQGIGANFAAWQASVSGPGLLWYPTFVAWPGPFAPPMPNVPTPLAACRSSASSMGAASLQSAIERAAPADVRARSGTVFVEIAMYSALSFQAMVGRTTVNGVMGQGPVPTFAPPLVLCGPVVGGSTLPGGGHLA